MNYVLKRGLNVPVITVLDDSSRVIQEEQRLVIRHVVQDGYGADIVFGVGTTGEWNRLSNSQRQSIMEIEVDELRRINQELSSRDQRPRVEAWVGVNGRTRAEVL